MRIGPLGVAGGRPDQAPRCEMQVRNFLMGRSLPYRPTGATEGEASRFPFCLAPSTAGEVLALSAKRVRLASLRDHRAAL